MTALTIEPLDYALKAAALKRTTRSRRRRVVLLVHAAETFSALEPIVQVLRARADRFELTFFAIPRNYTGGKGECHGAEKTAAFLAERGIDPVVLQGKSLDDLLALIRLTPDFIFRQSPWDHHIPALFGAGMLGFAQLCYVPYGLMTMELPASQYNGSFHNACDLIFCESEFHLESFRSHRKLKHLGVHLTGYPRFEQIAQALQADDAASWPIAVPHDMPRVIWAPHHTVEASWLGLSTFPEHHQRVLQEAQRGRISLLVRPHPALGEKLAARGAMSQGDYDAWCAAIDATPYSRIDRNPDYIDSFAASDMLITDGVGFFSEYLLTAKPLVRTRREGSSPLNAFGNWLAEAFRDVHGGDELQAVFDELGDRAYVDDYLPARLDRQAALNSLGTGAAERIADCLESA